MVTFFSLWRGCILGDLGFKFSLVVEAPVGSRSGHQNGKSIKNVLNHRLEKSEVIQMGQLRPLGQARVRVQAPQGDLYPEARD